ncbi:hypothetical protein QUB06_23690, partial [Microcoleus sp. D2_18a_D3]
VRATRHFYWLLYFLHKSITSLKKWYYFNRPGPRLVDSLEILAEILHPEIFDFGYRGKGWQPFL